MNDQKNRNPQKVAKWAGKASQVAANQYFNQKQNHQLSETSESQEEVSETTQDKNPKPDNNSRRKQVLKWGKRASLLAANEYLRQDNKQADEQKKLTPMETFLEILNTAVFGIAVLAGILLFLLIRFGLGQY